MKLTHRATIFTAFIGYITQAITINFVPLLFVTFGKQYNLSLTRISSLIAVCFIVQLITDALTVKFPRLFKPRPTVILGQLLAVLGLLGLAFLPRLMPPYLALLLAVLVCGIGSGLVEIMVTPVVEACPTSKSRKASLMCLLHSFYCLGHVLVVLVSTLFFALFGIENWPLMACLWAIIPFTDMILFCFVPLYSVGNEDTKEDTEKKKNPSFFKNRIFWLIFLMMICGGAAELAMGQWASSFAESALGVTKATGDLLGACLFATLMGSARVFYGLFGNRISLDRFMAASGMLCILSYLIAALSPWPILSLVGCALCGLSVGIIWPGNISRAAALLPGSGVDMFALLALAGDLGCLIGPTMIGSIADLFGNNIRVSFLVSLVFPVCLLWALYRTIALSRRKSKDM